MEVNGIPEGQQSNSSRIDALNITNPKRHTDLSDDSRLFPYYAGYSTAFTTEILRSAGLRRNALVLDPWNGAGTTVEAANRLGLETIGIDLNPVMVTVAKATLLSSHERPSLVPLGESIIEQSVDCPGGGDSDPLTKWLDERCADAFRRLEASINRILISHGAYLPLTTAKAVEQVSPLAAFFYVALFRSARRLLREFIPTNPTWVKKPRTSQDKKFLQRDEVHSAFLTEVKELAASLPATESTEISEEVTAAILLGSSAKLPLGDKTADLVLSSPPYCTRIDYAVATTIELAILRYGDKAFDTLRRSLMGTSTVERSGSACLPEWGPTCSRFLEQVYAHPSKASKGYYYKSHLQYFDSLYRSVVDLHRVLKDDGLCVLVIQDSHYKEIHNDVPTILGEMGRSAKLRLHRRKDFLADRSMVRMNKRAKKYLSTRKNIESVLCFEKI